MILKRYLLISLMATAVLIGCKNDPKEADEPIEEETVETKKPADPETVRQMNSSVMARLMTVPELSTMGRMAITAGLADALAEEGPYTVFAPSNDAFASMDEEAFRALLDPLNKEQLAGLLRNHIVGTDLGSDEILQQLKGGPIDFKTMGGAVLVASMEDNDILLTDEAGTVSVVSQTDIQAMNGKVHVLNTVLNTTSED